jgi:LysR family pca operon transcriptional activator
MTQRMGQEVEHLLDERGVMPKHCLRSSSVGFIRELLHTTDMLTICPRMMMGGDLRRGALRVVPLTLGGVARPAGVIRAGGRPTPANAETLISVLRADLAAMAAQGLLDLNV